MTDAARSPKLKAWHLDRRAVVYIRQSAPQQVVDHQESTARQYALADRAVEPGWGRERVVVIDDTWARAVNPPRDGPASSASWPRSRWTTSG